MNLHSRRAKSAQFVRIRTFLLVAVPLAIPIAFTLFFVPTRQERALSDGARKKAEVLTHVLAANAAGAFTFEDRQGIQRLLNTAEMDPDVLYAVAYGNDEKELGSFRASSEKFRFTGDDELIEKNGVLHAARRVLSPTRDVLGVVQVGFSMARIEQEGREFRLLAVLLSFVVLMVAALMAWLLGRGFADLFEQLKSSIMTSARSVDSVVNQLAAVTAQQTAAAGEESTALNEMNTTATQVGQAAATSAQRAYSLTDGGGRAEEAATAGLESVSSATRGLVDVRDQVGAIATTIGALSERAAAIGEIASTVALLAERSNLLALNAAIEAARAGAQGRGFSVVAQEMRSLADGSNRSAGQVKAIIAEIQAAIARAVADAREGERRVQNAQQLADRATESIKKFAEVTREVAALGKEIAASAGQQSQAIEQMVESISHATEAGNTQLETTKQVEETSRQLRQLSNQMVEVISAGADEGAGELRKGPLS